MPDYAIAVNQFDLFYVGKSGDSYTLELIAINNSNSPATFIINPALAESTPNDWTISLEQNKFQAIIQPNSSEIFRIILTVGNEIGIGETFITALVQGKNTQFNISNLIVMHQSVSRLHILGGESNHSIMPIIEKKFGKGEIFNISSINFESAYSKLNSIKTIIWNGSTNGEVTASVANALRSAFQNNVNVFVLGGKITSGLRLNNLLPLFGVQFIAYCREGYGQAPYPVTLAGVEGAPINGDFGYQVRGNLINYLLPLFRITNPNTTTPIMTFAKSKDSICAVKVQLANSRAILLGMNPFILLDQNLRETLIERSIVWLESPLSSEDQLYGDEFTISATPNPATDVIQLKIEGISEIHSINISLIDFMGRSILNMHIIAPNSDRVIEIPLEGLASQVYSLVCTINGKRKLIPILKI